MFKIELIKLNKILEAEKGENLHKLLIKNNIPIATACDGEKSCGKCWVEVISQENDTSTISEKERKILNGINSDKNLRLSCYVDIQSNMIITTSYW